MTKIIFGYIQMFQFGELCKRVCFDDFYWIIGKVKYFATKKKLKNSVIVSAKFVLFS